MMRILIYDEGVDPFLLWIIIVCLFGQVSPFKFNISIFQYCDYRDSDTHVLPCARYDVAGSNLRTYLIYTGFLKCIWAGYLFRVCAGYLPMNMWGRAWPIYDACLRGICYVFVRSILQSICAESCHMYE